MSFEPHLVNHNSGNHTGLNDCDICIMCSNCSIVYQTLSGLRTNRSTPLDEWRQSPLDFIHWSAYLGTASTAIAGVPHGSYARSAMSLRCCVPLLWRLSGWIYFLNSWRLLPSLLIRSCWAGGCMTAHLLLQEIHSKAQMILQTFQVCWTLFLWINAPELCQYLWM